MDPAALIRQYGSRVAYMHLKDVDTYALSKAEGRDKMGTFRALGHGTVNFPAVKAALEEVGFDGVLCVELDRPEVPHLPAGRAGHLRGPGYKNRGRPTGWLCGLPLHLGSTYGTRPFALGGGRGSFPLHGLCFLPKDNARVR